jgi:YidC/Oxa1 family membrane protein insertase
VGFFEIFSSALAAFYAVLPGSPGIKYGIAIIVLTVAVRIVLLPLSIKQTRSMREMQRIQPEIKRIQDKYKGKKDPATRQKMNEETMTLYKEHGVNPFGGCLPLLLQFPVLIGLFYVIRQPLKYLTELKDSTLAGDLMELPLKVNQFLGIRLDCDTSKALAGKGTEIVPNQVCGDGFLDALPYLVLVALMGLTTWYQQKQMTKSTPQSQQAAQMQTFAKIMPIMLMVFAYSFPSGVVLYWLTTNVWTIGQQRLILRAVPPVAAGDGKAAGKASSKPSPGKPESTGPGRTDDKPQPKRRSSKKKKR